MVVVKVVVVAVVVTAFVVVPATLSTPTPITYELKQPPQTNPLHTLVAAVRAVVRVVYLSCCSVVQMVVVVLLVQLWCWGWFGISGDGGIVVRLHSATKQANI